MRPERRDVITRDWLAVEQAALAIVADFGGICAFARTRTHSVGRISFHADFLAALPHAISHPDAGDEGEPRVLLEYHYPAVLDISDVLDQRAMLIHEGAHLFLLPEHGHSFPTTRRAQHSAGWRERLLLIAHRVLPVGSTSVEAFIDEHFSTLPTNPDEATMALRSLIRQTAGVAPFRLVNPDEG